MPGRDGREGGRQGGREGVAGRPPALTCVWIGKRNIYDATRLALHLGPHRHCITKRCVASPLHRRGPLHAAPLALLLHRFSPDANAARRTRQPGFVDVLSCLVLSCPTARPSRRTTRPSPTVTRPAKRAIRASAMGSPRPHVVRQAPSHGLPNCC